MGLSRARSPRPSFRRQAVADSNRYDGSGPAPRSDGVTGGGSREDVTGECALDCSPTPADEAGEPRNTHLQHISSGLIFSMKTQTSAGFRDPASAPRVETVEVPEDRDGQRVDNFLTARLKGVPKSLVYRLLRTGQVRVNGKRAKPDLRLAAGDAVRIPPVRTAERGESGPPPAGQTARVEAAILSEDREFLVIDKPAGVASHGGSGVSFGAIELLRAARPRDTLELVHRLDRDTSGVLVLAKKRSALTALQAEIREGRVGKRYLALLEGRLPTQKLTVDAPLRKSVLQGGERMVRVDEEGKASRSRFSEVERFAEATLAEIAI